MKKKLIAIVTAAVFVASLAACGTPKPPAEASSTSTASSESVTSSTSSTEVKETSDKWELNVIDSLHDEDKAVFEKAMEDYDGDLTALDLLGTQLVAGTNYMFLCKDADNALKVAIVYEDLDDNTDITSVSDFDLEEYETFQGSKNEAKDDLVGGWEINTHHDGGNMPQKCATAFSEVFEGFTGAKYEPVLYLGSKDGDNHAILCMQTTVTVEPIDNYAVVFIHAPENEKAEITNICPVDLTTYK